MFLCNYNSLPVTYGIDFLIDLHPTSLDRSKGSFLVYNPTPLLRTNRVIVQGEYG